MSEETAGLEQLCGRALLGYRAVTRHHDPVRARSGTHPVGEDEDGLVFDEAGERLLNGGFVFHIQAGGGFVQQNDGRILQKRTGDGNALTFAAGKLTAVITDVVVPPVVELLGAPVRIDELCARYYVLVRHVLALASDLLHPRLLN